MLGHAFPNKHEARENLYNKLDLIVGRSDDEREERHPQNENDLKNELKI